ncbi:uncharacterized protein G2W53_016382 [Senna tora]|uniref:Uncharacterized protein n=1 Tax=Senna tora TaxID=362788 RepID=A0A834TMU9_9FABA|nr:uncharacterized protein G2W53_016382 [Senna tora]
MGGKKMNQYLKSKEQAVRKKIGKIIKTNLKQLSAGEEEDEKRPPKLTPNLAPKATF